MVNIETAPNVAVLELFQFPITPTILHVTMLTQMEILSCFPRQDRIWNCSRAQSLCLTTVYMCGICSNVPVPFLLAGQQERATALQGLFFSSTPQFHMEKWPCLNFLSCRRRMATVRFIRVKVCSAL